MTDHNLSSARTDVQGPLSSNVETFTFRVEPSSVPVFITKLSLMLGDNELRELISWSNDGKRFCVFDIPGFSKMVLPQYFKHSNWPSFVRQLNMYGFHKVNNDFSARNGQLICEFHNPLFYRNGRLALRKIRRNSRKSVPNSVDPPTLHSPQQSSLQHPQQEHHHQRQRQHQRRHQHQHQQQYQPQQLHNHRCQNQSSPSYRPESSIATFSIPTSSMPISSLLTSNDNDDTLTTLKSTTNNITPGMDAPHDDNHNDKHRISDNNNKSITDSSKNAFDIDSKNITTYTSINIDTNYSHSHYIKKDKGKSVADIRIEYSKSQSNRIVDSNSAAPLNQQYTEIRQQLDLLQSSTAHLNSEMSFLKRYVAKQQESVVNLLNYLSTIIEDSEHPGLINQKQHQEALKALQVRSEQEFLDTPSGKGMDTPGSEKSHLYHHHHHYYHHLNYQINDGNFDGLDVDAIRYVDDDNNSTKETTKDTLHELKENTEQAKKDHHMHIYPLDNNKESSTLDLLTLDNNKHNNHNGSQSNSNCSNNNDSHRSTASTGVKSPSPSTRTTTELLLRSAENG